MPGRIDSLNVEALRMVSRELDVWIAQQTQALGEGGSLVDGDVEATAMHYSKASGYILALNEVKEKLLRDVEARLIRGD